MAKCMVFSTVLAALLAGAGTGWADDEQDKKKQLAPDVVFKKLDANGDGKISKDEFKKITELGQGLLKGRAELLDKVFDRLDTNADGAIAQDEFKQFTKVAERIAGAVPRLPAAGLADVEAVFKKLDADKDGKVTKDEFKKAGEQLPFPRLKDNPAALEKMFGRLDGDGNGSLSLEEFKKLAELTGKLKKPEKK